MNQVLQSMNAIYSKTFTVQINEVNHAASINISGILNWFQNVASEQSASIGIPITKFGVTTILSETKFIHTEKTSVRFYHKISNAETAKVLTLITSKWISRKEQKEQLKVTK